VPGPSKFWFVGITSTLPEGISDGIQTSQGNPALDDLGYALLCRAAANSNLAARALLAQWFKDSGVNAPVHLLDIAIEGRRLARSERKLATGMQEGDVLVRAVFLAYQKGNKSAQEEVLALIDDMVFKKPWQLWR
jgi:hypothetical protein